MSTCRITDADIRDKHYTQERVLETGSYQLENRKGEPHDINGDGHEEYIYWEKSSYKLNARGDKKSLRSHCGRRKIPSGLDWWSLELRFGAKTGTPTTTPFLLLAGKEVQKGDQVKLIDGSWHHVLEINPRFDDNSGKMKTLASEDIKIIVYLRPLKKDGKWRSFDYALAKKESLVVEAKEDKLGRAQSTSKEWRIDVIAAMVKELKDDVTSLRRNMEKRLGK